MTISQRSFSIVIDGLNLGLTAKALGFEVDYKKLLREFQGRGTLLRAFFYMAVPNDQQYSPIRPLVDWLDYNGFTVVTKAEKECIAPNGGRTVKGSMDVRIAVDAMELANRIDEMILFSGRGNLRPLVEAMQRRGVRVAVVSSIASQPPMVADELRRQADQFIELADLRGNLAKTLLEEHAPPTTGRVVAGTRVA